MRDTSRFVVRGRWVCEALIATTPTSAVWRGRDRQLDRRVAVRIFDPAHLRDPETRRRVEQTVALSARLEHDNVARLYDAFDDPLGLVLISELAEGPTLREVCDHLAPMSDEAVAAIGVQLAHGTAAIDTAGIAHRDLTPGNVRVAFDGTLKILGLGAARPSAGPTTTPVDGGGDAPRYLAPEQLTDGVSTHRSDIYAIGLMLWELAVGTRPFEVDGPARAAVIRRSRDVPPLRTVRPRADRRLSDAIERATRCDPARRWADAGQLAGDLLGVCTGRPQRILRDVAGELLPQPVPVWSLSSSTDGDEAAGPDDAEYEMSS